MTDENAASSAAVVASNHHEASRPELIEVLTWLGQSKRQILAATAIVAAASFGLALLIPPIYTARCSLLPPGSQPQGGTASAIAALGSLGGLAGNLGGKTSDELYVALLKSDTVVRALSERFGLRARHSIKTHEALRKAFPNFIRIYSDKKTGVISIEADDEDPKFAADLANAHLGEVTKLLSRLAVSEAQQRRLFFQQQLKATKDDLVKAEADLRRVQEKSGVIVLDKQAEALIAGAAQVRGLIAEREVRLKVMRTGATDQNPDVMRLSFELQALRSELARMESSQSNSSGSTVDIPVGRLPEAAIEYVRARRELKLQEALMEAMMRQFELAKLDEAKEGPLLQSIDLAMPPDYKAKPSRLLFLILGTMAGLFSAVGWVVIRRYSASIALRPRGDTAAWASLKRAWRLRG